MIAPHATGAVANSHDSGVPVPGRRLFEQPDIPTAVPHLKPETLPTSLRHWLIAFGTVVEGVAAGNRANDDTVAAEGNLHFVVNLQTAVALPLAERHVIAGHSSDPELGVRHDRRRQKKTGYG